jgi:hypothetical protein
MRINSPCAPLAIILLLAGSGLTLTGCSSGPAQPPAVADSPGADVTGTAGDHPELAELAPDVEAAAPRGIELAGSDEIDASTEPIIKDPDEQLVLSWARDAGGLNHCDRLSIYDHGRAEAVACTAAAIQPAVHGTLSDERLARLLSWVAQYAAFTRREMETSRAVRSTLFRGTGDIVASSEARENIAAFAADVFLEMTGQE